MTDRPILFSGPMVRALLDGRKTQTRRVLGPDFRGVAWSEPSAECPTCSGNPYWGKTISSWTRCPACVRPVATRYAPGDRLWVREHWRAAEAYDDLAPSAMGGEEPLKYEADGTDQMWGWAHLFMPGRHRQAMHMPRWASRLTLIVTDARVQRLQDISEVDAIREGVTLIEESIEDPRMAFMWLWDSLNSERGFGWDANPWVCALTFTVHPQNIDTMGDA